MESCVCRLRDSHGIHKGSDRLSLSQTADRESPMGKQVAADRRGKGCFQAGLNETRSLYLGLNSSEKIQSQGQTICPVSQWRHRNSPLTRKDEFLRRASLTVGAIGVVLQPVTSVDTNKTPGVRAGGGCLGIQCSQ